MKQEYSISIYLDTRRARANGKFPVKLRVYTSTPRKQMLYPTKFNFSIKEFNSIWNTTKPRSEYKEVRKKMLAVEAKANKVADKLSPFTFEVFERKLFRKAGDGINVNYHYDQAIYEFNNHSQIGTANTYELSRKSIKKFVEKDTHKNFNNLTFYEITPTWLKDYEYYMTSGKEKRSLTTVSIYLRVLRAIFNKAVDEKEIEKEFYPFGKRKYQVPATKNVKKALSNDQLKALYQAKPETKDQSIAKDFWFLSYALNGMNIKDILLLKYKDIKDEKVKFYRAKTRLTSKTNSRPITAHLNDFSKGIIDKYGIEGKQSESLVFNIISNDLTPQQELAKIKNFTRFINQHLKKLCKANELPEDISTYWARHSYATNAIRKGATMEFIQESLGHNNLKTTMSYFAGFDDDSKKEFASKLMDF